MTPAPLPKRSLQAAADALRLLAACFYPPDPDLLREERVCENLGASLEGFSPEASECARRLGASLADTRPEDLRVEHARLFLGPFEVAAPPYGSVYRDGPKVLMGPSTLAVQRAYREAGLTLASDFHEVPDHVAAELEFAAYLLAGGAGDESAAAEAFLREHLLPWAPAFCDRVEAESQSDFYTALARCLRAGLRDLAAALSAAPAGEGAGGGATGPRPHASP
ncbi:MAG: molecular chaperone TorD family protein [Thermodesulfobacteriota bacterium]